MKKIKMSKFEENISKYGCKDSSAIRLTKEKDDLRTDFFRDIDRIIYSLSYTRYIDKTQVFSRNDNDHLSRRMTHVQFVSKIARTIGRALNLNEDLIEAASLGHDLGHVPFGHVGEKILNKISIENNQGYFSHNIQSVRLLKELENNGKGCNLTIQVLDAIMCHNGEKLLQKYEPKEKSVNDFLNEYLNSYYDINILKNLCPMTLEGCVVKICDIIGYIGRDLEDGIRLGIVNENDIPLDVKKYLGTTNRHIINTIVLDIITNSLNKPFIMMSDRIYKAVSKLLEFNYNNIYYKSNSNDQIKKYEEMFNKLFNRYLYQLLNKQEEDIYTIFLNNMSPKYLSNNSNERIIIDYIAGMTDDFFINQFVKYCEK